MSRKHRRDLSAKQASRLLRLAYLHPAASDEARATIDAELDYSALELSVDRAFFAATAWSRTCGKPFDLDLMLSELTRQGVWHFPVPPAAWFAEQHAAACGEPDTVCSLENVQHLLGVLQDAGSRQPASIETPVGAAGDGAPPANDELERCLEAFSRTHFKLWFGGASYVGRESKDENGREQVDFVTAGDLTRYYSHVRVPVWSPQRQSMEPKELAKEWLDWPAVRTYERVVFRPSGPVAADSYNLWRGLAVDPMPGACDLYWEHVRTIVCNGDPELYIYVRRWLAHAVQRIEELPELALVLRGLQGTGKGAFMSPLLRIFGGHSLVVHSMDHVSGRFNAHLKDVVLLFADEAFWGGDRSREGLIKSLVTERRRLIEPKNKDAIQVDSFTRLVLATNTDWPVSRDHDDRRFLVLDVSDARKEDAGYFAELAAQMENGGTAALLYDLLNEDLVGWHPRNKPARSTGFDLKLRSAAGPAQWWHECLVSEANRYKTCDQDPPEWWDECPPVDSLHVGYRRWCEHLGRRYIESRETWSREFRKLVPHLTVYRPPSGQRQRRYLIGTVQECRASFETHFRSGPEIWDDPAPPAHTERWEY